MDISAVNTLTNPSLNLELNRHQATTNSFQNVLNSAVNSQDDVALKDACMEFESYFIHLTLKEMRKTIPSQDSIVPKSQAETIFQDMLDEETAKNATQVGGIGLAQALYEQMKKQ